MRYVYEQPDLERELNAARTEQALEAALQKVIALNRTFRDPGVYGRRLFARGLDALIPALARRLKLEDVPGAKSNDNACIIGTEFYPTGGHTRVAMDIMERFPQGNRPVLMGTGIYASPQSYTSLLNDPKLSAGKGERAVVALMSPTLVGKIIEQYMILKAMRPTRIFLMAHHMDIVAAIAAWPFRDVVEFMHHADHMPAIGVTLPFSAHVDLTYTCHLACREAGIDAIYSGMSAARADASAGARDAGQPLRIATCGGPNKYSGVRGYAWRDYAVAALQVPGTEVIHIGPTTPEQENEIRDALATAGIATDRYVFAGLAPSLGAELVKRQADIYLSSFPETGGKANLEAMGVGLPVIVPIGADLPPLTRFSLPLPHYLGIDRPDELAGAIDRALELRRAMREPDQTHLLEQELKRFDDYVANGLVSPSAAGTPVTV